MVEKITLLTITGDRPLAFSLLEKYVKRQVFTGQIDWVVVDDGVEPTACTLNQRYIRREPSATATESYRGNFLEALKRAETEKIIVLEDDEWYGPQYVRTMSEHLDKVDLAGFGKNYQYNVRYRRFLLFDKMHFAFMSQTAFRSSVVPRLVRILRSEQTLYPDMLLWREELKKQVWNLRRYKCSLTLGIKGMPGKGGISFAHRPDWYSCQPDLGCVKLKEFIKEDAEDYLGFYNPQKPFYEDWLTSPRDPREICSDKRPQSQDSAPVL